MFDSIEITFAHPIQCCSIEFGFTSDEARCLFPTLDDMIHILADRIGALPPIWPQKVPTFDHQNPKAVLR